MAFVRSGRGFFYGDLWIQSVEGGKAERLTFEQYRNIRCPTWSRDSQQIIFSAWKGRQAGNHLFRVPVSGGKPEIVTDAGLGAVGPCVRGDRLVFVQSVGKGNEIWRTPGPNNPNNEEKPAPERIIYTSPMYMDHQVRVSPDGQKIAFTSSRGGDLQVWASKADGSGSFRLANQDGARPDWSPNGQRIAFVSIVEGKPDIYVVDAEGGKPERLTTSPATEVSPGWSHDGRWISFASGGQIWKISAEGGEAIQVTRKGGGSPRASANGEYIYYQKKDGSIWRVPVEGGEERKVLDERARSGFDIVKDRLYYAKDRGGGGFSLHYRNLKTGRDTLLLRKEGSVSLYTNSISATPDEKWIYYAFKDTTVSQDINLIENFR